MAGSIVDPEIVKIATADTEQDLINNSGETREMSLLMHISNNGVTSANVEVWVTDSSNTKLFPLLPKSAIPTKNGITNGTKLTLKAGNKIRITADSTDVYAMICPVSGV